MRNRLPIVISACALLVAVLGATPLGHAAGKAIQAIPPFAKTAGYAKISGNSALLNGRKSTLVGTPGTIPVVGKDGKLPASIGAVGPQGPAGPKGDQGSSGAVDAFSRFLPGPINVSTADSGGVTVASLSIPKAGTYAIWAKALVEINDDEIRCNLVAGNRTDTTVVNLPSKAAGGFQQGSVSSLVVQEFPAAGEATFRCGGFLKSRSLSISNLTLAAISIPGS